MNKKTISTLVFLFIFLFLALIFISWFFGSDFSIECNSLSYTRNFLLGMPSNDTGSVFVDPDRDCYTITDDRELLRQRGQLVIAEDVARADTNEKGLIWLTQSGDLFIHKNETVFLSDSVCEFAVNKDSVCYYRKNGGLYLYNAEGNRLLFHYPAAEYSSPSPSNMDILVNERWIFLAGLSGADNYYYDRVKESLVVMKDPPYYTPPDDTAILWGNYLLCFMGYAEGGMIYNLEMGIGQPLNLGMDASEHFARSSAMNLGDTLYIAVQYSPLPKFEELQTQQATFEFKAYEATFEIRRINDEFYKQLFEVEGQMWGIHDNVLEYISVLNEVD